MQFSKNAVKKHIRNTIEKQIGHKMSDDDVNALVPAFTALLRELHGKTVQQNILRFQKCLHEVRTYIKNTETLRDLPASTDLTINVRVTSKGEMRVSGIFKFIGTKVVISPEDVDVLDKDSVSVQ